MSGERFAPAQAKRRRAGAIFKVVCLASIGFSIAVLAILGTYLICRWFYHLNGAGRMLWGLVGVSLIGFVPLALPRDVNVSMFLFRGIGWFLIGGSWVLIAMLIAALRAGL